MFWMAGQILTSPSSASMRRPSQSTADCSRSEKEMAARLQRGGHHRRVWRFLADAHLRESLLPGRQRDALLVDARLSRIEELDHEHALDPDLDQAEITAAAFAMARRPAGLLRDGDDLL